MARAGADRFENRLEVQRIVDRAAATLQRHARTLVPAALINAVAVAASRWLMAQQLAKVPRVGVLIFQRLLITQAYSLFEGLCAGLLTAWITVALLRDAEGAPAPTLAESLSAVARRAGPVALAAGALVMAEVFGLILLVVPGVIVTLGGALTTPALMAEPLSPLQAFQRSWRLTRGHRLALFGLFLAWLVAISGLQLILGIILAFGQPFTQAQASPIMAFAAIPALTGLAQLAIGAGVAAAYVELVALKETGPATAVGEVFA
jgi:hypothetical protein